MKIELNRSLKSNNSFQLDVKAKFFTEVSTVDQLHEVLDEKKWLNEKKLILGGGSNILFTGDFDGLVIRNAIKGIAVLKEDAHHVWIRVAAGEVWHEWVMYGVSKNLSGVENLSLIPGLVGAAPMQNIGAYGVEVKETCEEVEAIHLHSGEKMLFGSTECKFGYRESIFKRELKDQLVITAVTFRLNKVFKPKISYGDIKKTLEEMRTDEITIKAVSDAVIIIRTSKLPDPQVIPNAGSFFKNPVIPKKQFGELISKYPLMPNYPDKNSGVKIPAGWLIEQCGWKGKRVGNTGVHSKQALVLVNYGGATGEEISTLAMEIQKSVSEKFRIELVPEVNII